MGSKTVKFSDLTGKVVEDESDLGRLVVEMHPRYADPIVLEVLPQEVENELKTAERYVLLTYARGDSSPERYVLDLDSFNSLSKDRPMEEVLDDALINYRAQQTLERRQQQAAAAPSAPEPRRRGRPRKEGAAERIDYTSPEHAGEPHRGRVSPEEAAYVREHFDEVNKRLSEQGMRMIDPADPKMKDRYGLE